MGFLQIAYVVDVAFNNVTFFSFGLPSAMIIFRFVFITVLNVASMKATDDHNWLWMF